MRVVIVPVDDEPIHYELWRTPTMRVIRPVSPVDHTCLWHEHRRYTIYVCITDFDALEEKCGAMPVPVQLPRGSVFCRDHATEPLVHRATTNVHTVIVAVELFQPRSISDPPPEQEDPHIVFGHSECVHRDHCCRVDRLNLLANSPMEFQPAFEGILVSLTTFRLLLVLRNKTNATEEHLQMEPGSVLRIMQNTDYVVTFESSTEPRVDTLEKATLFLVQVFDSTHSIM